MSKTTDQIVKREVGERIKLSLNFEKGTTKALDDNTFECIVTTSSKDRHGESIVTEGIDTTKYLENPVVLYGHDYFGLPIGKTTKLTKMKNKMKATFTLATDKYDFAASVAGMIKDGMLNAVSIGGVVKKWSEDYMTIMEMEMVEFSIVSIPANSEALITSRSFENATGKTLDVLAKEYEDFTHGNMVDKFKHMGNDEVKDAIKVMKLLIDRLQESAEVETPKDEPAKSVKRLVLADAKAIQTQSQKIIKIIKLK